MLYSVFLRSGVDALQAIETEIRREKAEALGRAGERLEDALKTVEGARGAIAGIDARLRDETGSAEEAAPLQEGREKLAARLPLLRDRADRAYQYLIIQREAVGVRSHLDVARCYRVSERLG
jgi:hypothetical protein